MLIIARRLDEAVVVDGMVTVRVLAVSGQRVRLGFDGPGSVYREEIVDRCGAEKAITAEGGECRRGDEAA